MTRCVSMGNSCCATKGASHIVTSISSHCNNIASVNITRSSSWGNNNNGIIMSTGTRRRRHYYHHHLVCNYNNHKASIIRRLNRHYGILIKSHLKQSQQQSHSLDSSHQHSNNGNNNDANNDNKDNNTTTATNIPLFLNLLYQEKEKYQSLQMEWNQRGYGISQMDGNMVSLEGRRDLDAGGDDSATAAPPEGMHGLPISTTANDSGHTTNTSPTNDSPSITNTSTHVFTSQRDKLSILKAAVKRLFEEMPSDSSEQQHGIVPDSNQDSNDSASDTATSPTTTTTTTQKRSLARIYLSNSDDRTTFASLLECTTSSQINYFVNKMNIYIDHLNTRGPVTKESKEIIRNWLKKHGYRSPNSEERMQLVQQTGISRVQLQNQLAILKEPATGKITHRTKSLIEQWLQENKGRMPTPEEKRELCQKTGIARRQLNHQIYLLSKKNVVEYTKEMKNLFQQFFKEREQILSREQEQNSGHDSSSQTNQTPLTHQERQQLQQMTGLSSRQLSYALFYWRGHSSNFESWEKSSKVVKKWMQEHDNRMPTKEQKKMLLEETGLSQSSLHRMLKRLRDPSTPITADKKRVIAQWLEQHSYRLPNSEEFQMLKQQTELSQYQVYNQIYWMKLQRGKKNGKGIPIQKKREVREGI